MPRSGSFRVPTAVPTAVPALLVALAVLLTGCGHIMQMRPGGDIPADLVPVFQSVSQAYGLLSPAQLAAQARVESRFDSAAVSRAGAVGMMQFLPRTWAEFGLDGDGDGVADPLNPADAIPSAARYEAHLADLVRDLPGDLVSLVLAAYNAGPTAVCSARGIPDFQETRAYVDKVHEWAQTYETEI